jgi:hypothetical protein
VTSKPNLAAAGSDRQEPSPDPADRLAAHWEALLEAATVAVAADGVVQLLRTVAQADAVGLLVRDDQGRSTRLAACGSVMDSLGSPGDDRHDPVAHPLADGGVLAIDDTHGNATWPAWSARAARRGVRSARFIGMPGLHGSPTTLELYARRPHAFDAEAAHLVTTARHAGLALRRTARVVDLEQDAQTQALVGQASGILMERYHLTADQSMNYLVRSSERARLALRELAWELVAAQDRAAARTRAPGGGGVDRQR